VRDRRDLEVRLSSAKARGVPVVVEIWADWCAYCADYHGVIDGDSALRRAFERLDRLRIDVTEDAGVARGDDLREILGVPQDTQPYMAFVDACGTRRRDLDLTQWHGARSREELVKRVDRLGQASAVPWP